MSTLNADANTRPQSEPQLTAIAQYVSNYDAASDEAWDMARYCLADALGCGLLALQYDACARHLGPIVPGTTVPHGARVPGTSYQLDPVKAAFDIGTMVRWLDFNDTFLAAEWGHPSDNLGAILAVADYETRRRVAAGQPPLTMRDVLLSMIKAYEIQGVLALANSFNQVGLDHVVLVKVSSAAVATQLLGGTPAQIADAMSHAWVDGQALRTYRHAPNTGSRKSWAAGDATSRATRLAMMTMAGEMGIPTPLSAPKWGFCDVCFKGRPLVIEQALGCYVIEHILFKISFPAEFHAQTAVECAMTLHAQVKDRLDQIERIVLSTQSSAIRIISKTGPLHNSADRDHCLQYMVSIGLIFGELTADHYEDHVARDPRIDALRDKMQVVEDTRYSKEYLDADKRSIANAVQIFFRDGSSTEKVAVEYPIGHRRRRAEGKSLLEQKFKDNLATRFIANRAAAIFDRCMDSKSLRAMPVSDFMDLFTT